MGLGWGWAEDSTNWVPLLPWKAMDFPWKAVTIRVDDPGGTPEAIPGL